MKHQGRSITHGRRSRLGMPVLLGSLFVLLALLMGCSRGTYPLDFFSEMHYQQSYRIQEPPSLSAPADSVPITGREVDYTLAQARELEIPGVIAEDVDLDVVASGAELFSVNCAVCHGLGGKGDGPMRTRLEDAGYLSNPADLTASGPTAGKSEGEVFQLITKGFGATYGIPEGQFLMPPFRKLMTEEDRWTLVYYIKYVLQP
jgi:mono/diheme cytochrome c family protein